ncbi:HesB-like protein [Clostridium oryzae]|uniref:Iron-sulfur cluster insertion protein ErpA n=1 Tax=Clostridium oryzae TaxID=1450648 RepID=A0A1V4IJU6_9CLOT|nr:HesB-like protein [Clostridium oryzae]OPJ60104.1 hypothetical protein CLORY_29650 [Clostridium oryzae]
MSNIFVSNEAYAEFKAFLDANNVTDYNIRINYAGTNCAGAVFNIFVDSAKSDDVVEQVNDINFIIAPDLLTEFGGFIMKSSEENDGRGLSLRPVIDEGGNCGTCGGCH